MRLATFGKRILSRLDQAIFNKLKDLEQEMMRQGGSFTLAAKNNGVSIADLNKRLELHNRVLEKIDRLLDQVSHNIGSYYTCSKIAPH